MEVITIYLINRSLLYIFQKTFIKIYNFIFIEMYNFIYIYKIRIKSTYSSNFPMRWTG